MYCRQYDVIVLVRFYIRVYNPTCTQPNRTAEHVYPQPGNLFTCTPMSPIVLKSGFGRICYIAIDRVRVSHTQ